MQKSTTGHASLLSLSFRCPVERSLAVKIGMPDWSRGIRSAAKRLFQSHKVKHRKGIIAEGAILVPFQNATCFHKEGRNHRVANAPVGQSLLEPVRLHTNRSNECSVSPSTQVDCIGHGSHRSPPFRLHGQSSAAVALRYCSPVCVVAVVREVERATCGRRGAPWPVHDVVPDTSRRRYVATAVPVQDRAAHLPSGFMASRCRHDLRRDMRATNSFTLFWL